MFELGSNLTSVRTNWKIFLTAANQICSFRGKTTFLSARKKRSGITLEAKRFFLADTFQSIFLICLAAGFRANLNDGDRT